MAFKGFNASIAILPESDGWGSSVFTEGHYVYADSITLSPNQEFKEHPDKLVYGRGEKASTRTIGPQKPGGDIQYQFRANDCIPTFMAFFQKYTGTELDDDSGTAVYTFVPEKGVPDWTGDSFGTGGYTDAAGDMFTVQVIEKQRNTDSGTDNSLVYSSGVVDQLVLTIPGDDDAKLTPTFKFFTVDAGTRLTADPNNNTYGSYSTLNPFDHFEGTFSINGDSSFDITNITITMANQMDDRSVLGHLSPKKYDFGKTKITGVVQIDAPNASLDQFGSMLADKVFSLTGTLYNADNNLIVLDLPNCKRGNFEVNPSGANAVTEYGMPFTAYESEDGLTAPITITVGATGIGSAFLKADY